MLRVSPDKLAGRHGDSEAIIDVAASVRALIHQWKLILAFVAVMGGLAGAYLITAQNRYTATTTILFDPRRNVFIQPQQSGGDQLVDTALVDSQVEIIKSENVALAVIRKLSLANDPAFMPPPSALAVFRHAVVSTITGLFSSGSGQETSREQAALDAFQDSLTVKRIGVTYAIDIGFRSLSPGLSARVANATADAYFDAELATKYSVTRRASSWLRGRLDELKKQATDADRGVQQFKSVNNLVDTNRGQIADQQLIDATSQLSGAQATLDDLGAKLQKMKEIVARADVSDAVVNDVLRSDIITRLQAQLLDLSAREGDFTSRYGAGHEVLKPLRNQIAEIRKAISQEILRISRAYESDYGVAEGRRDALKQRVAQLVQEIEANNKSQIQLRDLESNAQALRTQYDTYLQKFTEAEQQQTVPTSEARVITPATIPDKPSSPKRLLILAAALFLGGVLGSLFVAVREAFNRTFKDQNQVEAYTGFECLGVLSEVGSGEGALSLDGKIRGKAGRAGRLARQSRIARLALDMPFSRFAETLRNVKLSLDVTHHGGRANVVGIVSVLPGEGKSTLAANLAYLMAAAGHRVLLVDADFRSRELSRRCGLDAQDGLTQVLLGRADLAGAIVGDAQPSLCILPAGVPEYGFDAVSPHAARAMAQVVEAVRDQFEYVVVDFAPLAAVVDAKSFATLIDAFVLVIKWGGTRRDTLRDVVSSSGALIERVRGAVLNRAPEKFMRQAYGGQMSSLAKYYHTDAPTGRAGVRDRVSEPAA